VPWFNESLPIFNSFSRLRFNHGHTLFKSHLGTRLLLMSLSYRRRSIFDRAVLIGVKPNDVAIWIGLPKSGLIVVPASVIRVERHRLSNLTHNLGPWMLSSMPLKIASYLGHHRRLVEVIIRGIMSYRVVLFFTIFFGSKGLLFF
jgi:hypothetical protein